MFSTFIGTPREKQLYQNLSLCDFVQRLLAKRCAAFVGPHDAYMLLSAETGVARDYIKIGGQHEEEPFVLQKIISYDEVKLSAFLSISSHSELLNDGRRRNNGIIETDRNKIECEGVVVGIIGARFQKPHYMEYQDVVISPEQNIKANGYGRALDKNIEAKDAHLVRLIEYRKLWQKFYEQSDFLFKNLPKDSKRFSKVLNVKFDNVAMKKRYAITFDTLLLESQARAERVNKLAYMHIVGIGLGAWRVASHQTQIFLECFSQRVKHLLPKLNNIGVLHFSWFDTQECGDLKHNGVIKSSVHPLGGIRTLMENRNPAEKLKGPLYGNMLLVISFAWDANALPGNEFWFGSLNSSNDPSAACSTLITELHNPHINSEYVNGNNLHVASAEHGVVHISDYAKNITNLL